MTFNVAVPAAVPRTLIRTPQLNPVLAAMRAATAGTVLTGISPGVVGWRPGLQSVNASVETGNQQGGWLISSPGSESSQGVGWGQRDALVEIRDMNESEDQSAALLIRYVEDQAAPITVRTGIHVNGWTRPDRGESSCGLFVQTGAGGTLTAYHSTAMRPPGKPDLGYQTGQALEVSTQELGPAIYAASGANFPISHAENAYPLLTGGITAVQTTLPVGELSKIPVPGAAGIYPPGTWPTPLYLQMDNEYVSYTGTSGTSGPGNVTGVVRGINSTATTHPIGTSVAVARPNHAIDVVLARPISKGIVIEPTNGQFDTRPAMSIATRHIGGLQDDGPSFILLLNGNMTSVGTITGGNVQAQGNMTANATVTTRHLVGGGTGSVPTIAAGPGAGTSPTGVSINASDLGGHISLTTGSAPAASAVIATVTFGTPFAAAPRCVMVAPANGNASILAVAARPWADLASVSTNGFDLRSGTTGLTASTAYQIFFNVIG